MSGMVHVTCLLRLSQRRENEQSELPDTEQKKTTLPLSSTLLPISTEKRKKVVLIEDNLNTHNKEVLIEVLGVKEGGKIARKIEWHFTPKHASWLDQAEIEIHALEQQCLNRRIPDFHTMQSEVAACVRKRNKDKCGINWQFTREKARKKFKLS